MSFSIFVLYSLADKWKMSPAKVYKILNSTGIIKKSGRSCSDHGVELYWRIDFQYVGAGWCGEDVR